MVEEGGRHGREEVGRHGREEVGSHGRESVGRCGEGGVRVENVHCRRVRSRKDHYWTICWGW